MPLDFTEAERAEARRLNRKLDRLPRFRMQTIAGRWLLNVLLRGVELFAPRGGGRGVRMERRTVEAAGRRVSVRIFRPKGACRALLIDVHGGGWTIGNARMDDRENNGWARAGAAVVSIDYRLAVHRPLIELVDECEAAAAWSLAHAATEFGTETALMKGGSAGAHLAVLTLIRLRDRHSRAIPVGRVLLEFGLYDLAGTRSVREAGDDLLLLHGPTIRSTLCKLTPGMTDAERRDPALSPLYADLAGLPPALFIVGDLDVLMEDNQRMEQRWQQASGNSELLVAPDSPHAFTRLNSAIARKVNAYARQWLLRQTA